MLSVNMEGYAVQYVNLGQTGLKVSRLVLGCMSYGGRWYREYMIDEKSARSHFRKALDLGINFFDTADTYANGESEQITGKWLTKFANRDDLVVASKVFNPMGPGQNARGLSRKHIMEGIDASLKRLGTDYLDLYQIHRFDEFTPIEETIEALHDVVKSGKVLYVGASSMFAYQFSKMLHTSNLNGWTRFVSMQNHYNLIYREEEREMMPLCEEEGVGVIPWAPLAKGYLSGKRRRNSKSPTKRAKNDPRSHQLYDQANNFDIIDRLIEVSKERGYTPAQIAIAWLLHKPYVTAPIIGATRVSHITDAAKAVEIQLDPEEMTYLEELYEPHRISGIERARGIPMYPGVTT
jgi:aryl-alcohol dehydrogenase-like predicted oxidoreductase